MTWCFHPQSPLHSEFYQMKQEDMDMYRTKRVPAEAWREKLRVGDKVDVRIPLNEDEQQIDDDTFMGWVQARIERTIDNIEEDKEDV